MIRFIKDLFAMPRRIREMSARTKVIAYQVAWIEWKLRKVKDASHIRREIEHLAAKLRTLNDNLAAVLPAQDVPKHGSTGVLSMNPLQPLIDEVTRAKGINASVLVLINGWPARLQAAIDAALAGGATAQQVADAVGVVMGEFKSSVDALADAVAANP